ncbi:MAG: oxaloacetate decarboxylase [Rhodospirillaceae bacterium]|jgi:carboxyvinyl-carboxyphosphonate phosphorylmutase|nr:oxaloacetate decarboxylase [Rhodospirillaceae bacterium]MBT3931484.1 oxaloacetate decarboxylase [Rhodospirillaceae bacterium]MBT4773253.1 oxaloacetate decarboxylase [Rhodospirillaceae bacterium]MBT5356956.1 oxaloacetate decarboxylase [Rhodospirillaceae bacterium]MBT5770023.1 oxaloacetate decarboxylase [Rhodospirillaceae bacterium]
MRWSERRKEFRAILNGDRCVHPGSVADPMTARITREAGFEVGIFAGSVASMAVLAAPDLIVLTLSEFADQARRIGRASDLPLMVDADHGYGNALNVRRTVEELEMAGIAGMSIEDTDLPNPFGAGGKASLISLEEGVGKMRAALDARIDPDLVIAGRTSAPGIAGVEEAVRRVKAYEEAGVDALFLVGVKNRDDLASIAAEVSTPIILGSASREMMDREWLASIGVRVCLQGHKVHAVAMEAFLRAQTALANGTHPDDLENVAPGDTMKRLMRAEDYDRWSEDYL